MQQETYKHKGLRRSLIKSLKASGHYSTEVMDAMEAIPRHHFLPGNTAFADMLYEDRAFPIEAGQTISKPSTVAFQSTLLEIEEGMKVLEIGTGSGYQASVLDQLGAKVFTIERQKELFDKTKSLLPTLGFPHIKCFFGDGFLGLPTFAPFDRILITCAAPEIPAKLVDQLKPGGYFVLPLTNEENNQTMIRLCKQENNELSREEFGSFSFVPMLKGKKF